MEKEKWYHKVNSESDIVLSSRIRLARNLKDVPFPGKMSPAEGDKIISLCREAAKTKGFPVPDCSFLDLKGVTPLQKRYMTEKHVISPDLEKSGAHTALFLSPGEDLSIMINEEDHLRIQLLSSGMELDPLYSRAEEIDGFFSKKLSYAFHESMGYLTSCPTNLGTGLRASLMLHLPALSSGPLFSEVESLVAKSALVLRGIYGEGSRPEGAYYQLSNQFTLGCTERQAIEKLSSVARRLILSERQVREKFYEQKKLQLEDEILRAYGVLQNARILPYAECAKHLSLVRLGVSLGLIKNVSYALLNELTITSGPANIAVLSGEGESLALDARRADFIREKLQK